MSLTFNELDAKGQARVITRIRSWLTAEPMSPLKEVDSLDDVGIRNYIEKMHGVNSDEDECVDGWFEFPRLIAELSAAGVITPEVIAKLGLEAKYVELLVMRSELSCGIFDAHRRNK